MADDPRIIEASAAWAMGEVDHCLVVVWRDQPTPTAFRTRNNALFELSKANPQCALVEVVEVTSKAPSDETRRVAMEAFKDLGNKLSAIAFILEGTQVRSSLARAILTTMMFFVKQLQPTRIFKHPSDAAKWVRPYVKVEDPAFESRIVSAVESVRAAIK